MLVNVAAVQAAATGYQKLFSMGRNAASTFYGDYMRTVPSTGHKETYQISPLGVSIEEWEGDRKINVEKIFDYSITNQDWEATVSLPRNAWEDDQLGLFNDKFQQMGFEAERHPDILLANLLSNGFTAGGYDNVAFFSNSHPGKGGITRDNLVSGALNSTRFEEAFTLLEKMPAYNGKPLAPMRMGQGVDLIVHPDNRGAAEDIIKAKYLASGASNTNYERARLVVNPYLSTSTEWYLAVRGAMVKPFILQMRRTARLIVMSSPNEEGMFWQKRIIIGLDGRWSCGYGHPELIVGSQGT